MAPQGLPAFLRHPAGAHFAFAAGGELAVAQDHHADEDPDEDEAEAENGLNECQWHGRGFRGQEAP